MVSGSLLVTPMSSFGVTLGLTLQLKRNGICSELFMVRPPDKSWIDFDDEWAYKGKLDTIEKI